MKLIVMIPAYNEEETIGEVIEEIPREIDGIDKVEVLVINDGSLDNTVEIAKDAGADKVISFKENKGLAPAFKLGLETALAMGADIIVNTDAYFQYNQTQIPDLTLKKEWEIDSLRGLRRRHLATLLPMHKQASELFQAMPHFV